MHKKSFPVDDKYIQALKYIMANYPCICKYCGPSNKPQIEKVPVGISAQKVCLSREWDTTFYKYFPGYPFLRYIMSQLAK